MSNSLQPHGLQHVKLLCPPLYPRICSNSCPMGQCYLNISFSASPSSFFLQSFPASGSFPMIQLFASGGKNIRSSFSISPSNDYSGLISFRIDLLAVQGTLKQFSPGLQFKSINSLVLSFLSCGTTLTSWHDYWKNHSFDYMDFCHQSDIYFLLCCLGLS